MWIPTFTSKPLVEGDDEDRHRRHILECWHVDFRPVIAGYAEPSVSMPACALPSICRRDRQPSMPGIIWKDMGRGASVFYQCLYAWVQIEWRLCHLFDVAPKQWHFPGRIFWNSYSPPTEPFWGFRGLRMRLVYYVGTWVGRKLLNEFKDSFFLADLSNIISSVLSPEEGREDWESDSVALMASVAIHAVLSGITGIPMLSSVEWGPWVLMRSWNCYKDWVKVFWWWELYPMHNEFYLRIWARCVGDEGLDPMCLIS